MRYVYYLLIIVLFSSSCIGNHSDISNLSTQSASTNTTLETTRQTFTAINNKILCLTPKALSEDIELQTWIAALEMWGFTVDILQKTISYDLVHLGDHWYLHDNGEGSGDIDLVVDGSMQYKVLIFGAYSSSSYTHIESEQGNPRLCTQLLTSYPFVAIGRGAIGYCASPSTNNLWQISNVGNGSRSLNITNPTKLSALKPFEGYAETFVTGNATILDNWTSNVKILEYFTDEKSPAITRCDYPSGGCAIWFGYKTFANTKLSILIQLIKQYSATPCRLPVWSLELDSGTPMNRQDYIVTENWVKQNLNGYATFFMVNRAIDLDQPPNMYCINWAPKTFKDRSVQFMDEEAARAMADLSKYNEYIIGSHGYTHNQPWFTWQRTGLPVDGFADQDNDGILNWQDPSIEANISNEQNPNLKLSEYGELTDWDLDYITLKLSRIRTVLNDYGFSYANTFVGGLNQMLDHSTPELLSSAGFKYISIMNGKSFPITFGYRDGVWIVERVYAINQDPGSENPDLALAGDQLASFTNSFRSAIGRHPLALMNLHNYSFSRGANNIYELRDSYLPGFMVLRNAGYELLSTQAACNKNIGWLWTKMISNYDNAGRLNLTLTSSTFLDNNEKHELGLLVPFNIKSVKVDGNYIISVDTDKIHYGKSSGITETLSIESGNYNSNIPRLSAISTPATDVLEAVYKPSQGRIFLSFSGDFNTDISIENMRPDTEYKIVNLGTCKTNKYGTLTFTVPLKTSNVQSYVIVTDDDYND